MVDADDRARTAAADSRRRASLVGALADVRRRIHDAATAAGRDPRTVTLIAVTKNFPVGDALTLRELGVQDLGENRDQEARAKVAQLPDVRWHFLGRLQTNKARSVARYATAVHSVDRPELVDALAAGVLRAERAPLDVLVQVSLDGDVSRGGVVRAGVPALAEAIAAAAGLRLVGVMAVAPMDMEPDRAFALVEEIAADLRRSHPGATWVSAGMSADLEPAIAHGATHVRVGSALLGSRAPDVG